MGRSFERRYQRLRERMDRWDDKRRYGGLRELRRRLYRSRDGKFLGVFSGIAESMGFCVCGTRIIGCVILLTLTGFFGTHGLIHTVMIGGFFYLLAALLMQPPRDAGAIPASAYDPSGSNMPPPIVRARPDRSYPSSPSSYQSVPIRPKIDLTQLDQQLDRLNLRIQRMETIVTDRQFDWQRRMDS